MMKRGLLVSLALLGQVRCSPAVTTLSSAAEFETFRAAAQQGMVLLVFAPWCGHSRALMPEFERAAASSKSPQAFAMIDGTVADDVATTLDVKGYPTLMYIPHGDGPPAEYEGARQASAIGQWATGMLEPAVPQLANPSDVVAWTAGKRVAMVLFVADYASAAAGTFRGVAAVSEVPCALSTAPPAADELGLSASARQQLRLPALVAFSTHSALPLLLEETAGRGGGSPAAPMSHARMLHFGRVAALPPVVTYAAGQVEEAFFAAPVPLHLLFFHSTPLPPPEVLEALAKAAAELRGEAVVATVAAATHAEVAAFFDVAPEGSLSAPVLFGFSVANGTKFLYPGGAGGAGGLSPADPADLVQFARDAALGARPAHLRSAAPPAGGAAGSAGGEPGGEPGGVAELVGSTFSKVVMDPDKDVLVHLYSPQCGHCRKLHPVIKAVAAELAQDESVAVASCVAPSRPLASRPLLYMPGRVLPHRPAAALLLRCLRCRRAAALPPAA
jgi:protein disulfide-isomerase A1